MFHCILHMLDLYTLGLIYQNMFLSIDSIKDKESIKDKPGIRDKKRELIDSCIVLQGEKYVVKTDTPQFQAVRES